MLGTKEFYDVMADFERTAKELYIRQSYQGFTKESKDNWDKGYFYSCGETNSAFKIFLAGYSLGRVTYMNN